MHRPRVILIVGGGPAGTYAAIGARAQDPNARVHLLSDEPCEPYEKPPLSKGVLLGTSAGSDAPIAGPAGVAAHGVLLESRARCAAIDRTARQLALADGRRLEYDALVLATGAVVREVPELPASMPGVHYLRTLEDADALKTALQRCERLLVVGGGLIGLEAAAAAVALGVRVTVLEMASRILARVCLAEISTRVHEAHVRRGAEIHVSTAVRSVERLASGGIALLTADGGRFVGDAVLVGTGAKPDETLAAAAGLATADGIVVDEYCRTTDPAIFAAGDAVRFPGPDGAVRLENWRHAIDQGTVAGRNAAGASAVYAPVPSFWSEQYDLYIQGVGWPGAGAEVVHRPMPDGSALSFELRDGRLAYALGINAQRELSVARRLIERKVPVTAAALADASQPLAAILKGSAT